MKNKLQKRLKTEKISKVAILTFLSVVIFSAALIANAAEKNDAPGTATVGDEKVFTGTIGEENTLGGGEVYGTIEIEIPSTYSVDLGDSLTFEPDEKPIGGKVRCRADYAIEVKGDVDPAYYIEVVPKSESKLAGYDITYEQEKTRLVSSYYLDEGTENDDISLLYTQITDPDGPYLILEPETQGETRGSAIISGVLTIYIPQSEGRQDYSGTIDFDVNYKKLSE